MKDILKSPLFKPSVVYLIISLSILWSVPPQAFAYLLSSNTIMGSEQVYDRDKAINTIEKELESKVISQRLKDLGFGIDEIKQRLEKLSDKEIHRIATQIESVKAGGDGTGFIISVLIIIILILVILHLTGRRIIIQ